MGRKLSPAEADAFTKNITRLPDQEAEASPSYGSTLQSRIADALGLSVSDLFDREASDNQVPDAGPGGPPAETALSRDCSDLIAVFACVEDPEERQRLLKMVRDAVQRNKHGKL